MSDCRECDLSCNIRDRFDGVFETARQELRDLRSRQTEMGAEEFWVEVDFFYHKYPSCIISTLDQIVMENYLKLEKEKYLRR